MKHAEFFSSRWGLIMTTLGVAIGTGNIWRFPRIAAQNEGGTFLIPFFVFLLTWSIPIMVVEFSMGKKTRGGVVKSVQRLIGPQYGWIGGFIGFCTMGIMFYYSVVVGWCLKYFWFSLVPEGPAKGYDQHWQSFIASGYEPVLFHALAMTFGAGIVFFGISRGIERANRVFVPALFLLLMVIAFRAVTLPGARAGLTFLFVPQWGQLANHRIWLEAITQSAWSTGAGWGLFLTYSVYMRPRENVLRDSLLTGLGDCTASLLAGVTVICTAFALLAPQQAMEAMTTSNTGLTFMWIPRLFGQMVAGRFFQAVFFLALCFAAISSLIAMIELVTRVMIDSGFDRKKAVLITGGGGFLCGLPSALSIDFLNNQDWVWGLGLLLNGFLFTLVVWKFGISRFRMEVVHTGPAGGKKRAWLDYLFLIVLPLEFFVMMGWWFWKAITVYDPHGWWNPFHTYSLGTCLFQWGVVLLLLLVINRYWLKKSRQ